MSGFIQPSAAQLEALTRAADRPEPVFMLNLLRFKETASIADEQLTGAEAYMRYAAAAAPHLERVGGSIVWAGGCNAALIGPDAKEWDLVAVVRYPSRRAFLEMIGDADYQAIHGDREAAVSESRLIPCDAPPAEG
jgi:uncharacterized protein (DUF1330 family)